MGPAPVQRTFINGPCERMKWKKTTKALTIAITVAPRHTDPKLVVTARFSARQMGAGGRPRKYLRAPASQSVIQLRQSVERRGPLS